jgi:hypothetical protein
VDDATAVESGSSDFEQGSENDMRALVLILIIAVVAVLAAVGSGYVNISQVRPATAPQLSATGNGVTAKGGEAPAFKVETGSVKVGTKETTVKVPALQIQTPGNQAAPATTNAQ